MLYPDWQTETQRRRRGHDFFPSDEALAEIPHAYETDGVPAESKVIWLHYFGGPLDLWVAEIDRETGESFGYLRLAGNPDGAEWGYTSLAELEQVNTAHGLVIIERDLHWEPRKFGEIKEAQGRA